MMAFLQPSLGHAWDAISLAEEGDWRRGMRNESDSEAGPDSPVPPPRPRPKRGAFPTPKSEIERARPYIPDEDSGECPETERRPPTDVDGEPNG